MPKQHDDGKPAAAYVSFKTFMGFIESLKETTVPAKIDRSVMTKLSGIAQGQTMTALKFLGLTAADGTALPALKQLVQAYGTEEWASEFENVILQGYDDIIGELDLEAGTATQLKTAFAQRSGVEGQLLVKAVRFWLNAMAEAKNKVSPHFKAPPMPKGAGASVARNGEGGKAHRRKGNIGSNRGTGRTPLHDMAPSPPSGTVAFPIGAHPRAIHVPSDLTEAECAVIHAMDSLLRAFVKSNKETKR